MENFVSLKRIAVILLVLQTFNHVLGARTRGYRETPVIDPHDHVIIEVGADKEIECKSTKPITWLSELDNANVMKRYEILENSDDLHIYRGYLEVKSATVDIVGNYLCAFNETLEEYPESSFEELLIDHKATKFYIFVNDPENLLVQSDVPQVFGNQYEPFVIPCKPTSPQTKVELVDENGEVHYIGTYDSKIGFTVSFSHIEESGYFDCRLQDDHDNVISFHVIVNEQPLNITTTTLSSTKYFSQALESTISLEERSEQEQLISERLFEHMSGGGSEKTLALSAYIPKPFILSDTNFFAKDGATFTLTCKIEMNTHVLYAAVFTLPNGTTVNYTHNNEVLTVSNITHEHDDKRKAQLTLTISNAEKERDEGEYKCTLMDYHNNTSSHSEKITFVDNAHAEFSIINKEIKSNEGKKKARFLIDYLIYPKATFTWTNPKNEVIITDSDVLNRVKYDVKFTDGQIEFIVKQPSIDDFGDYTLVATVEGEEHKVVVSLIVSAKPDCSINDVYLDEKEDKEVDMTCECKAYPPAEIVWTFQPCNDLTLWPDCKKSKNLRQPKVEKYQMLEIGVDDDEQDKEVDSKQASNFTQISNIRFKPSQPGTVKCKAKNSLGNTNVNGLVQLSDLPEPFLIQNDNGEQIADGDEVTLECGAIIYNYTNNFNWYKDNELFSADGDRVEIIEENRQFSYRKILKFSEISKSDEGEYKCEVEDKNGELSEKAFYVTVNEAHPPKIDSNFNQSEISLPFGGTLTLECLFTGLPIPTMKWLKNGEPFEIVQNDSRVTIANKNSQLGFGILKPEDSGTYECVAENRIATDRKSIELIITTPHGQVSRAIIIGVISIILLLVILSIYLCCKVRNKKLQIAELKAAGLANFEEGNVESINPEISIDEQADLLPYDKKYEFPRDKLKLGKQLGAGAFGIVVKAVAEKIVHYEDESIVAVKMVKKQADNEVMKALVSELKIMIHLGQHLNVVNLLGAVTKNIAKRELMVIVEYCRFGNIQSFLCKHRPYFIDQVRNDRIDPMIMKNEMRWSKNSAYNSTNGSSPGLKYISVSFANDKVMPKDHAYINTNGTRYINFSDGNQYTTQQGPMGLVNAGAHMNSQGYVRHSGFHQIDSCNTEATVLSNMEQGEDSVMLSNNSEQPLWRTNYGMDYKGPARSVCTSDLICWAFQVARGMEYLASRKVLHGDLAARNILLCEDNIVKICDFGLARSMYKSDNYKKQGEAPLPFKWLSLEAISDHVFSTYSDVWAFGIVLWELFTLAKVPYPGMEANQDLFYKLRDGYRMEKPKYATEALYDIMLSCWSAKPESRPLFNELQRKLSSFLMDSVKDHYLDLNEPYLTANINSHDQGARDYLTSLSIPEEDAPRPPIAQEESFYINNSAPDVNDSSKPSYLAMTPKSGRFRSESPTITKNLDTSPKNKKNTNKKPELPEEIPMLLQMSNQNGLPLEYSDDEHNSYTEMSFTNGSKEEDDTPEYKNVFASNDNYVNVPAANKSIANPSYTSIKFNTVNERH